MDSNYIGRYVRANIDTTIFVVVPNTGMVPFDRLKAGETYPIAITRIINAGGRLWVYANTGKILAGKPVEVAMEVIESNGTANIVPNQLQYTPPADAPGIVDRILSNIWKLALLGTGAYILANYFKRTK